MSLCLAIGRREAGLWREGMKFAARSNSAILMNISWRSKRFEVYSKEFFLQLFSKRILKSREQKFMKL